MRPLDREAKARKKRKILLCTLIPTVAVGITLVAVIPLIWISCKKNDNVMDDVRLSDLKVGDNLINKYFLMPTNGWRIPRDITWNYNVSTFLSFSAEGTNFTNMEIWQNTTGVGVPISAETLRFTSNHVGDIRRYVCDSINKGIMNWTRDLGDISKNVAFKDYYYIQLSCKNTGATKLEITEINLTTYDLAFDEFLSNCWVSNNIK